MGCICVCGLAVRGEGVSPAAPPFCELLLLNVVYPALCHYVKEGGIPPTVLPANKTVYCWKVEYISVLLLEEVKFTPPYVIMQRGGCPLRVYLSVPVFE
ncbi:hypothetical protein AB205_0059060 [Aquarana catesbeiana]|uniref:Uncharacterized protein n=1 Tax=Aquarana catesbeiana TaxID=8400 RepID=A0A2G9RSN6_AQUCT|nr:hypothetical protein AB205_0059060 [Aquarana catesbeiana]